MRHEYKLTLDVMPGLPFRTVALALAATLFLTPVAFERRRSSKEKLADGYDIVMMESRVREDFRPATPKRYRT